MSSPSEFLCTADTGDCRGHILYHHHCHLLHRPGPALSQRVSLDLHHQLRHYLETSNEGGELVTHTRVKKGSALGLKGLS